MGGHGHRDAAFVACGDELRDALVRLDRLQPLVRLRVPAVADGLVHPRAQVGTPDGSERDGHQSQRLVAAPAHQRDVELVRRLVEGERVALREVPGLGVDGAQLADDGRVSVRASGAGHAAQRLDRAQRFRDLALDGPPAPEHERHGVRRHPRFGRCTTAPPMLPRWTWMRPSASRIRNASRIDGPLTPNCSSRVSSGGSRSPSFSSPSRMSSRMRSATTSASLGRRIWPSAI